MKYVYFFGDGGAEGRAQMKNLLGGKGANLAEMSHLGIPVPAGFTISTEVCTYWMEKGRHPEGLKEQISQALARVEQVMGARFGSVDNPLLLSVRSGARQSMPGMMDTVLNLGLNWEIAQGMILKTQNPRFVYDCYRRFLQMYGDVVLGIRAGEKEADPFEARLEAARHRRGVQADAGLEADDLLTVTKEFEALIAQTLGAPLTRDPVEQLYGAIDAVFNSWNNARAQKYRALNKIPDDWGTAVNVQAMVYGNRAPHCGSGVAFTRNPASGEKRLFGEFLYNAQGEDVVAGIRTPLALYAANQPAGKKGHSLEEKDPQNFAKLLEYCARLEKHYGDMQDVEMTIDEGKLWMLQTRTGKRTGMAAIRIATELAQEGIIDRQTALLRLEPENHLNQLLQPIFSPEGKAAAVKEGRVLAKGLAAGPGAATGRVVFSARDAEALAAKGEPVLLVRVETSPEDIRGMAVSKGILTARGGATSHAALVARQMGKVCVAGCDALQIDYDAQVCHIGETTIREGERLSLDGFSGEVILGEVATHASEVVQVLIHKTLKPEESEHYKLFSKIMTWSNEFRRLRVRANAEQPDQALAAQAFGAEGIGLCRTEHMFFQGQRIHAMQELILADDEAGRREALRKLQPLQEQDFVEIFKTMQGRPVNIRLLDPPLHEFLPEYDELPAMATRTGMPLEQLQATFASLAESNPMLGHRGCRLLVTYPEIAEMQVSAIIQAACRVQDEGLEVHPEIMIPLVGLVSEVRWLRERIQHVAQEILAENGHTLDFQIGTMIELPRACLVADEIAAYADFFSFGTNDLSQTTFGFSRDDSGKFLRAYEESKLLEDDPFRAIDQKGVGLLMKLGVEKGRQTKANLKIGICGEHGGEPSSVIFCHNLGLNYVSCSAFRIPVAILSAAQAALLQKQK